MKCDFLTYISKPLRKDYKRRELKKIAETVYSSEQNFTATAVIGWFKIKEEISVAMLILKRIQML
jgi:hypothetical protein